MSRESAITLKELSRLSGYSVSTVSKALNNRIDIGQDTRRYIKSLANEYNYIPNRNAIGLRINQNKTLALILPQIDIVSYSWFLFSFQKTAQKKDYKVVFFQSFNELNITKECLRTIADNSVDAALVLCSCKEQFISKSGDLPLLNVICNPSLTRPEINQLAVTSLFRLLSSIHKSLD